MAPFVNKCTPGDASRLCSCCDKYFRTLGCILAPASLFQRPPTFPFHVLLLRRSGHSLLGCAHTQPFLTHEPGLARFSPLPLIRLHRPWRHSSKATPWGATLTTSAGFNTSPLPVPCAPSPPPVGAWHSLAACHVHAFYTCGSAGTLSVPRLPLIPLTLSRFRCEHLQQSSQSICPTLLSPAPSPLAREADITTHTVSG